MLRNSYFSSTTCLPIPPHAILASEDIEDQTDPVIIRSYIYEHHFAKFINDILTVSSYFFLPGLVEDKDVEDDRRLHGRQLRGEGLHENVELAHPALHLRWRLPDASGDRIFQTS